MEQWTGSRLGKEYAKAIYCHPAYVTYIQSTSCKMPGWTKQVGIQITGRNISNLRYADDTALMAESKEEQKSLLMKVKEESEKADLKLNFQKTKIMASSPITSIERVTDYFLGSKITADVDCSHEIKRHLLLKRKTMTNLDSILKSRDITLPTKLHRVEAMVFQ